MFDFAILVTIIIGVLSACSLLNSWHKKQKYSLPPGPLCLPFVGYFPFLGRESFRDFKKLSEKYGNIISLYLGTSHTVIISDFELAKEAMNNPALLDRPPNLFEFHPDGLGLLGHNGAEWVEQRRYTMKTLRDIGLNKSPWEQEIEAEVEDYLKYVDSLNGQPIDLFETLSVSMSNNMITVILRKRFPMGDVKRRIIDEAINAVANTFDQAGIISNFPILMKIIAKLGFSQSTERRQKMVAFNNFIRNEVEQRRKLLSTQTEEMFIDGYLNEIEKTNENDTTYFNERNLIGNVQAVVNAGSETTRSSLQWLLLAMASYPDIQKKIQDEIDSVLGRDGKIYYMQREKLPYTCATIMEGQRWRTVVPLNVVRRANSDTRHGGYDIPKGTNLLVNLWAMNNDQKYWENAENFIPDRFLTKDGKLVNETPKSYLPFSMGRRVCPGKSIATSQILHYFVGILQKFHVRLVEGEEPILIGTYAATYRPQRQKLRFIARE